MPKSSETTPKTRRRTPPSTTPEGRENQMIALAYDLVEQRLRDGTASASETVAILKLGTQRERLEREKLQEEVKLTKAKTENIERSEHFEELLTEAMSAFKRYSGNREENDSEADLL